jgi:hypothetical protein
MAADRTTRDDFLRQLRPRLEHVTIARDEIAAMAADMRERPKAVEFRLKQDLDDQTAAESAPAA